MPSPPLFLITRPQHQAENLCALIEAKGGRCVRLPTLAIQPYPPEKIATHLASLDKPDIVIFTSANAVSPVLPYWHCIKPTATVFAIGPATAHALAQAQITAQIPAEFNSQSLLALPALQAVQHKRMLIFSGKGGRNLLKQTLQQRGAIVKKVAVYRRECPTISSLLDFEEEIACIISTSCASLKNLWAMAGTQKQAWLKAQRLLVISQKMMQLAKKLRFTQPPLQAKNASDTAIVEALSVRNFF
jgi:uroporphyrinogen-III synthase